LWEKLTDMPKPGCLPQMSQTAAMIGSFVETLVLKRWVGRGPGAADSPAGTRRQAR
jgi:hypothetical protein